MSSISFLQKFQPEGYWVLTAFPPDRKGLETETFTTDQTDLARAWIAERNDKVNLYFSVNQPIAPISGKRKLKKSEIATAGWLHVDVDPKEGEPLETEQKRILAALQDYSPAPTVIIFSGGGYQAFWKLKDPIPINGDLTVAEDFEKYNKRLAADLGGDNCYNIDRIMRLPDTWNLPDPKKVARGRKRALAEVHPTTAGQAYSLTDLPTSPPSRNLAEDNTPRVALRIENVDDLNQWRVDDRVKVIIVQGHDPDAPKSGDNSRSAWVFDVCCSLVRAGVPDDVILGVVTDPSFLISAHVLEQPDSTTYAWRQVCRAKAATEGYDQTKGGVIKPTFKNVLIALARHGDKFRFDEMKQCELINGQRVSDELINMIWGDIARDDGWAIPLPLLCGAILYLAQQDRFHPVREYLDALVWDGTPRIDRWTVDYLGADDTPYNRAVGRILLLGAVRRVRHPGSKFDTMIVLEGPQGSGKSSALIKLAVRPEWFTDHLPLDDNSVRLAESLQGNWIVEASELDGLGKADVAKLKTFLSSQEDKARMAYARKVSYLPRQCVIVGTTNDERYLKDETGNRRYLPIKTGPRINVAGLEAARDQLWAEAAQLEPDASVVMPKELWGKAAKIQDKRMERPPCYDVLEQHFFRQDNCWIAVADVRTLLGVRVMDWHANRDMGRAMKMLGWEKFDKSVVRLIKTYRKGEARTHLTLELDKDLNYQVVPPPPMVPEQGELAI